MVNVYRDKKHAFSLTLLGEQAPEHLLEARNLPAFWVYSNIISEQFVGKACLPLLRVVPNNAVKNAPHMESLDTQYLPLCTHRINSIKLKICVGPGDELVQLDDEFTCALYVKIINVVVMYSFNIISNNRLVFTIGKDFIGYRQQKWSTQYCRFYCS